MVLLPSPPLLMPLSPVKPEGDEYDAAASLFRTACGEKVEGRPDAGQPVPA